MPNCIMINGRLTKDVESRQAGESTVYKFSVADVKKKGENESVTYFDCQAWDRQGGFIEKYFKKGDAITIYGEMEGQSWTDGQTGLKRSKLVITVDRASFGVGGRGSSQGGNRQQSKPAGNDNRGGGRYQKNHGEGSEQQSVGDYYKDGDAPW